MKFDIQKTFLPAKGVDLVMNMQAPAPTSRSSIIFDADYSDNTITIAQPFIPVSPQTEYEALHLTTVIPGRHQHMRVGLACRVHKYIQRYPLAGDAVSKALVLQYDLPVFETNIRSAFRLPLSKRHFVKAKLIFQETDYYTAADFKILNISFTGVGILIPKKVKTGASPLTGMERNDIIPMGLVLVDTDKENPVATFAIKAQVKRVHSDDSKTHILAGLKIIQITEDNETLLNKFIHDAQIAELKRLRNLR